MSNPPHETPSNSFSPPADVESGQQIEATQAAGEAALPISFSRPAEGEQASGVVVRFRYANPEGGELAGTVSRGPSGLLISHLEVTPAPVAESPHGITTRMLQRIPVEKILAAVRARAYEGAREESARRILTQAAAPSGAAAGSKARKNAVDDALLQRVAIAYLDETAAGQPPGALRRIADAFDRPEKTIQGWLARARKEGWLGPGAKGRVGAEPGPRLLAAFARTPRVAGVNELGYVVVVAPPAAGSETEAQAQERAMKEWRERMASGAPSEPNRHDVTIEVPTQER